MSRVLCYAWYFMRVKYSGTWVLDSDTDELLMLKEISISMVKTVVNLMNGLKCYEG